MYEKLRYSNRIVTAKSNRQIVYLTWKEFTLLYTTLVWTFKGAAQGLTCMLPRQYHGMRYAWVHQS